MKINLSIALRGNTKAESMPHSRKHDTRAIPGACESCGEAFGPRAAAIAVSQRHKMGRKGTPGHLYGAYGTAFFRGAAFPNLAAAGVPDAALLNLAAPMFFSELARHYLWAQMHDVFYGSLMAENRRRLQHMEGAMQRMEGQAGEMQRKYNMLRREEVTEEIEVIMLSSDALQKHSHSFERPPGA